MAPKAKVPITLRQGWVQVLAHTTVTLLPPSSMLIQPKPKSAKLVALPSTFRDLSTTASIWARMCAWVMMVLFCMQSKAFHERQPRGGVNPMPLSMVKTSAAL
eukprot:CAMPEP_0180549850 /NCGR_PEP_ID=MMETSP1036_2-20121128/72332_1 /TAXON_ID=632150 /ORGANISM="Azadinium spinosum, Strain 3D9" /LENGTH=102 /DNA_ID=CAMNT_0022565065 /DNA_START=318 /DNA_END=623 /DNA_ORIENTATION=+